MENPDKDKDTCPAADMETLANTAQPAMPDYTCHICGYKPRASASNPKEALRKHMQRYHANESTACSVDAIVSDVLESSAKLEDCDKLYEDIQILKVKFPDIAYTPDIHPDSSYQALKRAKNTLVRLVNDRSGADAAFNIMLIGCRGAETATHFLGLGDIQGYATDIAEQKEDFVTVLKEMVDTGVIESTQLSPEVRLGLLLVQVGVQRMEVNRRTKNCDGAASSVQSKS